MNREMASRSKPIGQEECGTRNPDRPSSLSARRTSPTLRTNRLFRNQIQIIIKDNEKNQSSSSSRNRSPNVDDGHVANFVVTGVDVKSSAPGIRAKHSNSAINEGAGMTVSQKMFDRIADSPLLEDSEENEHSSEFDQTRFEQCELDLEQIPLPSPPQENVQDESFGYLASQSPEDGNNNVEKDDCRQHKDKRQGSSLDRTGRHRKKSSDTKKSKERRHKSEDRKLDCSHQPRKRLFPLKNESKRESPESERGASRYHSSTSHRTSPEINSMKWKKLKTKQKEKVQDKPSSKPVITPVKDYLVTATKYEPSPRDSERVYSVPRMWSVERMPSSSFKMKITKDSPQMKDKLQESHCVALSDSLVDAIPLSESSDEDTSVTPPSCTTSSQGSLRYASTELSSTLSSRDRNSSLSSSFVSEEIESTISSQSDGLVHPHSYQKNEEMNIMPRDYYIHTPPPPVCFQPGSYPWRPNMLHTRNNQEDSLFQGGQNTAQSRAIFEFATAIDTRYKRLQPLHDPPKPSFFGYQLIGDSIFLRFAQKLLSENPILAENLRFLGLCVSGQRVGELLKRLKSDFYHVGKKVVVLIGTNDLLKNTSLEQMCAELSKVVKFLRTRAEQVVLLTLPPIPRLEAMSYHWSRLHGYNNFIKQLSTKDSGVSVSDIFPLYLRTRDEMEEEELVAEYNAKTLLCYGCLLCSSDSDLDLQDCDSDLDDTKEILDNYCDPHVITQDITSMFVKPNLSKCRCDYYEMYFADSNRKDLIHLNHKGLALVKDHLFKVLS